jgi:hypothetical protein
MLCSMPVSPSLLDVLSRTPDSYLKRLATRWLLAACFSLVTVVCRDGVHLTVVRSAIAISASLEQVADERDLC